MTRSRAVAAAARPQRRAVVAAAGLAAAGLALTGCSYLSPAQVVERYPQSDGTWAELEDPATGSLLRLEDMLLVSAGAGAPGVLIGAIANTGSEKVDVTVSVLPVAPAAAEQTPPAPMPVGGTVTVPPRGQVLFGPQGRPAQVQAVPAPPGATVTLRVSVGSGEAVQFSVPVQRPQGIYSSVSPSATTTASPSPSGSPSPSPDAETSPAATESTTTSS